MRRVVVIAAAGVLLALTAGLAGVGGRAPRPAVPRTPVAPPRGLVAPHPGLVAPPGLTRALGQALARLHGAGPVVPRRLHAQAPSVIASGATTCEVAAGACSLKPCVQFAAGQSATDLVYLVGPQVMTSGRPAPRTSCRKPAGGAVAVSAGAPSAVASGPSPVP